MNEPTNHPQNSRETATSSTSTKPKVLNRRRCDGKKANGKPCANVALPHNTRCTWHLPERLALQPTAAERRAGKIASARRAQVAHREAKAKREADIAAAFQGAQRKKIQALQRQHQAEKLRLSRALDGSSGRLLDAVQRLYPGFHPILAAIEMFTHPQPVEQTNKEGDIEVTMAMLPHRDRIELLKLITPYVSRKPAREQAPKTVDTGRTFLYEVTIDGADPIETKVVDTDD